MLFSIKSSLFTIHASGLLNDCRLKLPYRLNVHMAYSVRIFLKRELSVTYDIKINRLLFIFKMFMQGVRYYLYVTKVKFVLFSTTSTHCVYLHTYSLNNKKLKCLCKVICFDVLDLFLNKVIVISNKQRILI